ncbi:hypothetical protein GS501_05635 [Saccharibacter sp. 17.LH.SD]|uniref:hypothetical protein n=1 Tax=Saccharibacter sp. 17.LH.SD TaxID=2689393 RepID=UPI001370462A|nr:hypothetical protein [Saccharibacter sp. 17.LH.SD]MXV44529.1 hypothetical protein [Saccharibacter sp. 17.LH.SD]
MVQNASLSTNHLTYARQTNPCNVVPLRQKILPRHRTYLMHWLTAGESMGLLDAAIDTLSFSSAYGHLAEQVLVWVRENPEPAYLIRPEGRFWVLIDQLREHEIGRYNNFALALHTIRPVLPLHEVSRAF